METVQYYVCSSLIYWEKGCKLIEKNCLNYGYVYVQTCEYLYIYVRVHARVYTHTHIRMLTYLSSCLQSAQNRLLIKNGKVVNDDGMVDSDVYVEDGIVKWVNFYHGLFAGTEEM